MKFLVTVLFTGVFLSVVGCETSTPGYLGYPDSRSTDGSLPGDENDSDTDPRDPVILSEGETVAVLEVEAPAMDEFILRGTIPVPPGVFPRPDGKMPFAIKEADGTLSPAQVEVVTSYPNLSLGADVVEVLSRVKRHGSASPGQHIQYKVVNSLHSQSSIPGTASISDLRDGPSWIPAKVKTLIDLGGAAVVISAEDVFGNGYIARPLSGTGHLQTKRHGEELSEIRVYQDMLPAPPVGGATGTLPHLFGVHAYVSTWHGEEMIGFDLRFHNGHSGHDETDTVDDALDTVYFKSIEIHIPSGWTLLQDQMDPFFGTPRAANMGGYAYKTYPLVEPMPDGKMHVIRWQGQFHRRLSIVAEGNEDRGRQYLASQGRAFVRRGTNENSDQEYYSWWNEDTARYFPQSYQLPSLEHVGHSDMRNDLQDDLDEIAGFIVRGDSRPNYPFSFPVLGWGHPYGGPYGGMTGGDDIFLFDGVTTAEVASRAGFQRYLLTHRMNTDRQPSALYKLNGEPGSLEDWLVGNSIENAYLPFNYFLTPIKAPDRRSFGVDLAPTHHAQYVESNGLTPDYQADHLNFDPHDFQHFSRYTRSIKTLIWLGNDSLAKDDAKMQAEAFNLSYHPYFNGTNRQYQETGMGWDRDYVHKHPASGFRIGRGEGWGLDIMNTAYASGTTTWRQKKRAWFDHYAQLVNDGQGGCNGFLQSNISPKTLDGLYRGRQGIEQSILENAIRGMLETVYRGRDASKVAMLEEVLTDSLYAMISPMAWEPHERAPWAYSAVGPLDENLPVWCSANQMPADGFDRNYYSNYLNVSAFAYGFELTNDAYFLRKALTQISGNVENTSTFTNDDLSDLLFEIEHEGLKFIENRVALIALVQRLSGEL